LRKGRRPRKENECLVETAGNDGNCHCHRWRSNDLKGPQDHFHKGKQEKRLRTGGQATFFVDPQTAHDTMQPCWPSERRIP
jgi:hypothetical protein